MLNRIRNTAETVYAIKSERSVFIFPYKGPGMPNRKDTTPTTPPAMAAANAPYLVAPFHTSPPSSGIRRLPMYG